MSMVLIAFHEGKRQHNGVVYDVLIEIFWGVYSPKNGSVSWWLASPRKPLHHAAVVNWKLLVALWIKNLQSFGCKFFFFCKSKVEPTFYWKTFDLYPKPISLPRLNLIFLFLSRSSCNQRLTMAGYTFTL